jgi:hypothetical protein
VPATPSNITPFDRARPWINRGVWVALVVLLGFGIGSALATSSRPIQLTGTLVAWIGWAMGLAALAIAHPIGLTTLRFLWPAVIGVAGWIAVSNDAVLWQRIGAVCAAVLVTVTIGSAETATWCIDGPSYPNECRHALKTPPGLLPITALSTVITLALLISGPLLLAAKQWLAGALGILGAAGTTWVTTRSMHQLSRRFVVFVPAGFVLHDAMVVLDPVLFRRNVIERMSLAAADTDSLDLTRGAAGTPIELLLTEKVELTKLSGDMRTGEVGRTARLMFSPMRPGAVLREAAARRLPVA